MAYVMREKFRRKDRKSRRHKIVPKPERPFQVLVVTFRTNTIVWGDIPLDRAFTAPIMRSKMTGEINKRLKNYTN